MAQALQDEILAHIKGFPETTVWTAIDFAELGRRDAVDKALQRLEGNGAIKRITRGLYQQPTINAITKRPNPTNYADVLEALERRDGTPMLVDGMTAANDLGFTTAVPAKIIVHTSSRRSAFNLNGQQINFRNTAPSKLRWAGRPAMRLVQALQWLYDDKTALTDDIVKRIKRVLDNPSNGEAIKEDLKEGFSELPSSWMQDFLRPVLFEGESQ